MCRSSTTWRKSARCRSNWNWRCVARGKKARRWQSAIRIPPRFRRCASFCQKCKARVCTWFIHPISCTELVSGSTLARFFLRWKEEMNRERGNSHGHKTEYTSLWPDGSAREPSGAAKGGVRKMVLEDQAAVGNRKQEGLSKIEAGVPADRQPKVARSVQRKSEDCSCNDYIQQPNESFAGIPLVYHAKCHRKSKRRGPESDAASQRVLRVSAKQELFRQANEHKRDRPKNSPAQKARPMNGEAPERVSAESGNQRHKQAHFPEPEHNTEPKKPPEGLTHRQSVQVEGTPFKPRHQKRRSIGSGKINEIAKKYRLRCERIEPECADLQKENLAYEFKRQPKARIEEQTPANPQSFFLQKNPGEQPLRRRWLKGGRWRGFGKGINRQI